MPTHADFTVIQDEPFALPTDDDRPRTQREFRDVSCPAVSPSSPSILMFRTFVEHDSVTVQVRVNNTVVTRQTFDPGKRAWIEVIPPGVLKPSRNAVLVSVTADDPAAGLTVGSIVVQYRANTD